MSSTIAYDPDEFDNNPFAEPVTQPQHEVSATGSDNNAQEEPVQPSNNDQPQQSSPNNPVSEVPANEQLIPERHDTTSNYKITVKVHGLERSGSLTNKKDNPGVIFDLSSNLPRFRKKMYKNLKKSYNEFETFFKFLNGANPECFIPSLPAASTSYGIQNEEDYKKTISNFQRWFNRVTSNPILIRNEEFAYFVDSDFNTYSPVNKSKLPASGLKRKTLKQLQPPYDEALELAEFRPLIKSIYKNSKSIEERLDKLTKLRKTLGIAESEMGVKVVELSELETHHPGMANMWKKFGKTISSIGDLDSIMGTLDLATLGDGLAGIVNDGYVIKEALTNRHLLMRELINAQSNTKSKREHTRKLRNKRDLNPVKVDMAIKELEEALEEEDALSKKIKRITEEMLIEKVQYLEYLDLVIKQILKEFTIRKIEYERRKLLTLERIRLDVRSVDSNGGLARLGRENYPVKASQISSSQTLNGDEWSGDRKTSHFTDKLLDPVSLDTDEDLQTNEDDLQSKKVDIQQSEEETPLNPREAASLLGVSSFN